MTTTGKRALLIFAQLAAPLRDRVVTELIIAGHLRLGLAGLDFADDLQFEFARECAPFERRRLGGPCALLGHR